MGRVANGRIQASRARIVSSAEYKQAQLELYKQMEDPLFCRLLTLAEVALLFNMAYQTCTEYFKNGGSIEGVKSIKVGNTYRFPPLVIKEFLGMPIANSLKN